MASEKLRPFSTDLAGWAADYIADKIREHGIEVIIVTVTDEESGRIGEYFLNTVITIGYTRFGMAQRLRPFELIEGYHEERLDAMAAEYVEKYHWNLNSLREE